MPGWDHAAFTARQPAQVRLVMHDTKTGTVCADFVLTNKSRLSAQAESTCSTDVHGVRSWMWKCTDTSSGRSKKACFSIKFETSVGTHWSASGLTLFAHILYPHAGNASRSLPAV